MLRSMAMRRKTAIIEGTMQYDDQMADLLKNDLSVCFENDFRIRPIQGMAKIDNKATNKPIDMVS